MSKKLKEKRKHRNKETSLVTQEVRDYTGLCMINEELAGLALSCEGISSVVRKDYSELGVSVNRALGKIAEHLWHQTKDISKIISHQTPKFYENMKTLANDKSKVSS